jgi:hypothetical protein
VLIFVNVAGHEHGAENMREADEWDWDDEPFVQPATLLEDELREIKAENAELRASIEKLAICEDSRAIVRWARGYARMSAALNEQITASNQARREATREKNRLAEIRKALGVERDRDIVGRLRELVG